MSAKCASHISTKPTPNNAEVGSGRKKSGSTYNFHYIAMRAKTTMTCNSLKDLVGASGFEPEASCAQGRRATRLRYAPT
jgi:hypothetical protein